MCPVRVDRDRFIPLAADLARCALMIQRGPAARSLEALMRRTSVGSKRGTSTEAVLTMTAFALQHFHHARHQDVQNILHEMFPHEVVVWLGLSAADDKGGGRPISEHQWRNFWRIVYTNVRREDLFAVTNALLLGWTDLPPLGDTLLFDSTPHPSRARPLAGDIRRRLTEERSPDLLLDAERRSLSPEQQRRLRHVRSHRAYEAAWGHATPTYDQPRNKIGGFHAHPVICASAGRQTSAAAPTLVIATDLTPASGYSAPDELLFLLDLIDHHYGTAFTLVADRDYSKKLELWRELRRRGRQFAFDLRVDQLPVRGEFKGVLLAQGNCLCPATPEHLRNPGARPMTTKHEQPNPDYEAWLSLVHEQMAYRCRVRSNRANGVNVSCPALGPSPTVDYCPRRGGIAKGTVRPVVLEPPNPPPLICTQTTVHVPDAVNDLRQTWPWGRNDWLQMHRSGRSHNEGVHGELKSPDGFDLRRSVCDSSHIAVVAIHLALVQALFNLAKLRAWVEQHPQHPFSLRAASDPLLGPDSLAIAWLKAAMRGQGI